MQLGTRLVLVGALLPTALLLVALFAGGVALDRILHATIDRALLSQAAVEAVSLFDRAGAPHMHLIESPLDSSVREFAPRGALYGPGGALITRYPEAADVPPTLAVASLSPEPQLADALLQGGSYRVVEMQVLDPAGAPHGLWLAASLETHDTAVRLYWQLTGVAVAFVAAILAAVQILHARRLHRRVLALDEHMTRLRAGDYGSEPPPDRAADVIGRLRDAIAVTTRKLAAARDAQERLVADAAHELRTPLTAMRAGIDVALRRRRDAAELERVLGGLREEVDRLAELASRLLDMAALRAAPLHRAAGDVARVVAEAVESALGLAEERGVVLVQGGLERAQAEIAPSVLRQAIDNLLDNAIKFSPTGGRVEIDVRREGVEIAIVVTDGGPGVPQPERARIFEPFEREDRGVRGKGLGLAIVHEVAERHGGRAHVQSRADGRSGAVFVITVPVAG